MINTALLTNCNPIYLYTKSNMAQLIRKISRMIKTFEVGIYFHMLGNELCRQIKFHFESK